MTPKPKKRQLVKVNALAYAHLIKALVDGAHTVNELADICGLKPLTVYHYCRELHRVKAVHISDYAPDARGYYTAKVYMLGEGKDAKKTRNASTAVRMQRSRARKKERERLSVMAGTGQYVKSRNGLMRYEKLPVGTNKNLDTPAQ